MKALDVPPVWLALCLALAWAQVRLLPLPFPETVGRDIGALAVLAALFFIATAIRQMRRHRTAVLPHAAPSTLVTSGVFAKSRNPIYLGFLLVLAGASLWLGSVLGLVLVPVLAVVLTRRFILPEERRLADAFGPAFADYAARTRRWL